MRDILKKVFIGTVVLGAAFAFGRYTAPEKVKTEIKTVEVKVKDESVNSNLNKNKHKKTKTVEVIKPNGEKIVTTVTDERTGVDKTTQKDTKTTSSSDKQENKEVTYAKDKVTLSLLAGKQFSDFSAAPVFGAHITKPVLGPITLGAFVFTNSLVGLSVGVNF